MNELSTKFPLAFGVSSKTKKLALQMLCLIFLLIPNLVQAQISGTVYRDLNFNGTRQTSSPIEPLVSGVTVTATLSSGAVVTKITTSASSPNYSFSAAEVGSSGPVRIEFITPEISSKRAASGTAFNETRVQFVNAGASASANFAVSWPAEYSSSTNPTVITPTHINGDPNHTVSTTGLVSFPYNSDVYDPYNITLTKSQIGSTWGVAYDKYRQKIFLGAFLKRHVGLREGLSSDNTGAIYTSTSTGANFGLWTNIPSTLSSAIFNNVNRGVNVGSGVPNRDETFYAKIGKQGLGDIEIDETNKYLYAVNLNTKNIVKIAINTDGTAGSQSTYAIPTTGVTSVTASDMRPFALKFYKNKLYVGVVFSAQSTGSASNLKAAVYVFDPATNTFNSTPIYQLPLNYTRGAVSSLSAPGNTANWRPWSDSYSTVSQVIQPGVIEVYNPQPILSDIEFDESDNMILAFMDRAGHQFGSANYGNTNVNDFNLNIVFAAGELLKVCNNSGVYSLCPNTQNNGLGPNGGEFYSDHVFTSTSTSPQVYHEEHVVGSLAILAGSNQVMVSVYDPLDAFINGISAVEEAGVVRYNNTTGNAAGSDRFSILNLTNASGMMRKANGLGDLELLTAAQPIEVGNRIWFDTDGDGLQDPSETTAGVPSGTTVTLRSPGINGIYGDGDDQTWTTTTDANGNYFFSSLSSSDNRKPVSWTGIGNTVLPGYDYRLEVAIPSGRAVTILNASSNTLQTIDNDAFASGTNAILPFNANFTSHNFDFGFITSCVLTQANAGTDKSNCNSTSFTMTANSVASGETGTWSVVSGTASAASPNSPTTNVTLSGATATLRWTISKAGCTSNFDDVIISNTTVVANAGGDQSNCNNNSFTMAAASTVTGTGAWTVLSGTATITSPSNTNTTVTLTSATATLRWTATSGTCTVFDDVIISNTTSTANAGADQSNCNNNSFTMAATGTGTWSVVSGTATISASSSATTAVTLISATATLRWTVTSGTCTVFDDVIISNTTSTANAGADQSNCNNNSFTMAATGTGTWSVVSGTATISASSSATTAVTLISATATLRWTVTSGTCTVFDDVIISNTTSTANAGADQSNCNNNSFTMAATGTGTWSVVSGTATISASSSATTAVTLISATATLRWTVTSGTCTVFDDVIISNTTSTANAGADQSNCNNNSFTMAATGTGTWSVVSGTATISASSSATTAVTLISATATLRWTVTSGTCTVFDDVIISNTTVAANAGSDQSNCNNNSFTMAATGTGTWSVVSGTATISASSSATTAVTLISATATLRWTVTSGTCTVFDDVIISNTTVAANAGSDQSNCNNNSFTMAATGTGTWSVVSGTATISASSSATTAVTLISATATLRWTVTSGTCTVFDDVIISNTTSTANAGADQSNCNNNSFTMAATGTGTWSVVSGTATISASSSATTTVTLISATATLRWTVTSGTCTVFDDVIISNTTVSANAGSDQSNCNNNSFTMAATGTGTWSVVSGTATISASSSATTTVTLISATATLRWTVTSGTCTVFDDVIISNTTVAANAGSDQSNCNNNSFTMAATGTGTWSVVSGTATISASSSATTAVTLISATATLRWTVTSGTCTVFDDVIISNTTSTANAGADQSNCNNNSFTMAATGTGTWSVVSGTATISASSSATTTVTLISATATLRWTVTSGTCTVFDDVIISNTTSTANAGADQSNCNNNSFTMAATGTGTWSVVSGTATISASSSATTTVTLISATATLRWTVTSGTCTVFDDVIISNTTVSANAGSDQSNCNNNSFTMAATGTGTWSVVSGTATISASSSATTTVILISATATLRWTVTSGTCTVFDDVIISNTTVSANAGSDQSNCNNNSFTMAATGTGTWSVVSGTATISASSSATTTVTLISATATLRWTVTSGTCTVFDDVIISNNIGNTLGDYVWFDTNNNGIQDVGESPISGVTVKLYADNNGDNNPDGAAIATTTTNTSGTYSFNNLCGLNYIVSVVLPAGYANTINTATSTNPNNTVANDNNGVAVFNTNEIRTNSISLSSNNPNIDFGFRGTAALGNFVFNDTDGDGIQDAGELGIPGATVVLTYPNGQTATTTTNASGIYSFTNLAPTGAGESYTVTFTTPIGFTPTTSNAPGSTEANDSDPISGTVTGITLTSGQVNNDIDAGYRTSPLLINLYGNVWHDANALIDNQVNKTSTIDIPVGLNVYLVDDVTGLIVRAEGIEPDGTYSFLDIESNHSFRIVLSSVVRNVGQTAPPATLPSGWRNTGENLGAGPGSGSDGVVEGVLYIDTETSDIFNANFGIRLKNGEVVIG